MVQFGALALTHAEVLDSCSFTCHCFYTTSTNVNTERQQLNFMVI